MFCKTNITRICSSSNSDGISYCAVQYKSTEDIWGITTAEKDEILETINYWLNGIIGCIIAIIGLIMNIVTLLILRTQADLKHMMNYLLTSLLITDNIFLITQILNIFLYNFKIEALKQIQPHIVYPIEKTSLTMAVFCIICLAHQGYLITWDPVKYRKISASQKLRRKRATLYFLPALVLAVMINIPRWFSEWINDKALKKSWFYVVFYENFILSILTVFVPITLLVFFNWSVRDAIRDKQHDLDKQISTIPGLVATFAAGRNRMSAMEVAKTKLGVRDKMQTRILIVIIIFFIICHFPRCVLKFFDGFPKPIGVKILETLERVLLIIHATATPFIYIVKNKKFRNHLYDSVKRIFCYGKLNILSKSAGVSNATSPSFPTFKTTTPSKEVKERKVFFP